MSTMPKWKLKQKRKFQRLALRYFSDPAVRKAWVARHLD